MSMQMSPNLGRYGLRPIEVIRAYGEGAAADLPDALWLGPISDEEREECVLWRQFGFWWEEDEDPYPWWAYECWEGWDRLMDAEPDFFPDQVGLEKLGYYDDWRYISLQAIDAYAEQVIQQKEHDEYTGWILDLMEAGAFLREVFGERERLEL